MIVLVVAASGISTTRTALNDSHYNRLARQAAESGAIHAQECAFNSGTVAEWSNATNSQLRPGTGCKGGSQCTVASCYVLFDGNLRSTYSVGAPTTSADGSMIVTVRGITQLLRASDNSVWKEYEYVQRALVRFNTTPQIASGAGWKTTGHNGYMLSGEGVLWGWGDNDSRQLGGASLGSAVTRPVRIALPAGMSYVRKIVGSGQGASFLCAVMVPSNTASNDAVYCRGNGGLGMSGVGDWVNFTLPATPAQYPVDIAVQGYGKDAACVLTNIGNVYCVGENVSGQMGLRTTANTFVPVTEQAKQFLLPGTVKAKQVFTQDRLTCVIGTDGKGYCAGDNALGQLGRGNKTTNVWVGNSNPEKVQLPGDVGMQAIRMTYHSGSHAMYFLASTGRAYMAGAAWSGTANDGTTTNQYTLPTLLGATNGSYGNILSVGQEGTGRGSVCIIEQSATSRDNSGLWCTGATKFGQNGRGVCGEDAIQTSFDAAVVIPNDGTRINPDMGPAGDLHMNSVMVIDRDGIAYAAGDNTYGKLGTGAAYGACNSTFKKVRLPSGVKAVAVANADEYTAYILGDDDSLYAMGRNNEGQLGNGTTTNSNVPVKVEIPRQASLYY